MFKENDLVKVVKFGSENYGRLAKVERVNPEDYWGNRSYLVSISDPYNVLRTYSEHDLELHESKEPASEAEESVLSKGHDTSGFDSLDSFVDTGSQEAKTKAAEDLQVDVEINIPTEPLDKLVEALDFIGNALQNFGSDLKTAAEKFKDFKESIDTGKDSDEFADFLDNF